MRRPRSNLSQRPSSYVINQLAIRIRNLSRIYQSNPNDFGFARDEIIDYMFDIGIHENYFERVFLMSSRLIRTVQSTDIDYVLGAINGIFDTMYPHDEL